jgi:hypothetical protein
VISISYTQEFLKQLDLRRYCSGSAQPQLTNAAMMNIAVRLPSQELLIKYPWVLGAEIQECKSTYEIG